MISRIANGESVGTRFPAPQAPLEQRKRWIFASSTPDGILTVDHEAVTKICELGESVLPEHVTGVNGNFNRGSIVIIRDFEGVELARGIVRYDRSEMDRIKGCSLKQIDDILGYGSGPGRSQKRSYPSL